MEEEAAGSRQGQRSKSEKMCQRREGRALWCCSSMPGFTARVQARTLGSPSTVTRQLGQFPAAQRSPRGRWYLKLRLKVVVPAA